MFFGAVAIALLMMSTVTAVPLEQSKPVMDKAAQIEEIEQLMNEQSIKNILASYGFSETETLEITAQSQTLPHFDNELTITSLDELFDLIDMEGLSDYFTSVNFANFMKSDGMQDLLDSDIFLDVYNCDVIQDFIQTDVFTDFLNSDEVQIFLDNFNDGNNELSQTVYNQLNEYTSLNLQTTVVSEEMQALLLDSNAITPTVASTTNDATFTSTESGYNEISVEDILYVLAAVLAALIIGLITWIPAIIISLVAGVLGGLAFSIIVFTECIADGESNPLFIAVVCSLSLFAQVFFAGLVWPLILAGFALFNLWTPPI